MNRFKTRMGKSPIGNILLLLCLFSAFADAAVITKTWYDETAGYSEFDGLSFEENLLPPGNIWKNITIRQYWVDCVNTTVYLDAVNSRTNNLINDGKGTVEFLWNEPIPEKFGRCLMNVNGRMTHVGWGVDACYRAAKCSISVSATYEPVDDERFTREWWDETHGWSDISGLTFPAAMLPSGKEWKKVTVQLSEVLAPSNGDVYLKFNGKSISHTGIAAGNGIVFDNIDARCDVSVDGHLSSSNVIDLAKAKVTVTAEFGDIENPDRIFDIWGDETTGLSNIDLRIPASRLPAGQEWRKIRMVVFSQCANGDAYTQQETEDTIVWVFRHDEISPGTVVIEDTALAGTGDLCLSGHISHEAALCSAPSAVGAVAVWVEYAPKRPSLSGNVLFCHGLTDVFNSFKHFTDYAGYRGFSVYGTDVPGCGSLDERARVLARYIADSLSHIPDASLLAVGHSMGGLDLRAVVAKSYLNSAGTGPMDVYGRAARKLKKVFTVATPHQGNIAAAFYSAVIDPYYSECAAVNDLSDDSTAARNQAFPYGTFQAPGARPLPFRAYRFETTVGSAGSDCVVGVGSQEWPGAPVYPTVLKGRHCDNYVCQLPQASSCVNELSQVRVLETILTDTVETMTGDSLAAYWAFNESAGDTAFDGSGYGYNGPVTGGAAWSPGCMGNALSFNGIDEYMEIPYSPLLNTRSFSLSMWVKITGGTGSWRSVVTSRHENAGSGQSGYMVYAGADGHWRVNIGNGTGWSTVIGDSVIPDEWTHVAATYDEQTLKLYINGDSAGSAPAGFIPNGISPLRVGAGRTESTPTYFLNGAVDDLSIFNKAVPEEMVLANYIKGKVGIQDGTARSRQPRDFRVTVSRNPFNPVFRLGLYLPADGNVTVTMYNTNGEAVAELNDMWKSRGAHSVRWNTKNIAAGLYFYRIGYGRELYTGKMQVLR